MKKLQYIGLMTLLIFTLVSCGEDWLELNNPNTMTAGTFFRDEEDAEKAVNAVYAALQLGGIYQDNGMVNAINLMADDGVDDSPATRYYRMDNFELYTNDQCVNRTWRALYNLIYRANQCVEELPGVKMDQEKKTRMLAEVRFLRALGYFYLVNIYHNVPLVTRSVESKDDYYTEQAEPDSVWNFCIKEFKFASQNLPESYPSEELGRVTKWAAAGFLGKSYLYSAHGNNSWDQTKLQLASDEFELIIDEGNFDLVNDYRDNFTIYNENNIESIFEVQFDAGLGGTGVPWGIGEWATKSEASTRAIFWAPDQFGWADCSVSRGLFNAFKSESTTGGEDDPRLPATIVYNHPGQMVYGYPYAQVYGENADDIFPMKYTNNGILPNEMEKKSSITERVLRFADILLMQAECLNELGQTPAAVPFINRVRERANLETIDADISQANLRDRICKERFRELALEQWRLFDLQRWGWFYDEEKLDYLESNDPAFTNYKPGREYMPIPMNELETNPNMQQNPGYSANE